MKKNRIDLLAALVLGLLLLSSLQAQPPKSFKIIIHSSNPTPSLTAKEVSDVFLKKTTRWDNRQKVRPLDLTARSAVREEFSQAIHGRSVGAIRGYWAESIFSGRASSPPEMKSEADVVAYVEANANAIGYVSAKTEIGTAEVLNIED